jgi:glucokinase
LGCEGLADFKLRLASGLTGTLPITHVQVTNDDSTAELGAKVLGNTASAILHMRGQLNREMIDRSIDLLAAARRVEFCALGSYAAVAHDAQYKFLRFGIPAGACTETRLQLLAVSVLGPGDVVVIISIGGRLPELLELADRAHERGAAVVALTASGSPLARKADTVVAVDHVEDSATQVPMISRILKLLVIDILTVGVAMRRQGQTDPADPDAAGDAEAAPTLAHMTHHVR